jgi:hypothetical protein
MKISRENGSVNESLKALSKNVMHENLWKRLEKQTVFTKFLV